MKVMKNIKPTKGRIPLNKRITMKCKDCAGGNSKEITVCHLFDCPLWAVRFGYPMRNKLYKARMERAFKKNPEDFKELEAMGIKFEDFLKEHTINVFPGDV